MKINSKEMHGYLIAKSLKFEGKIAELCRRGEVYATDIAADSSRIGGEEMGTSFPLLCLLLYTWGATIKPKGVPCRLRRALLSFRGLCQVHYSHQSTL